MVQHTFDSADKYIRSTDDIRTKIARLDQVISALLDMSLTAAATGNFSEYSLDDGQTKIKTVYRSMDEVVASIKSFEGLKSIYVAQYNNSSMGRARRLVDRKNFNK